MLQKSLGIALICIHLNYGWDRPFLHISVEGYISFFCIVYSYSLSVFLSWFYLFSLLYLCISLNIKRVSTHPVNQDSYIQQNWPSKVKEKSRHSLINKSCWRRLLRVPWTARRSNQSILKEISPGISLEGMMLKLKLQYFGHFMQRVDSLEKTLMLGGIGGRRRRGWQRMRWLDGITDSLDGRESEWTPGVGDGQGGLVCCDSWGRRVGYDWVTELNWRKFSDNLRDHLARNIYVKFWHKTDATTWAVAELNNHWVNG